MAKQFTITGKKEVETVQKKVRSQEKVREQAEQFIDEGEKYGTIALPPSMWKALKLKATTEDKTIKRLVKEGVEWRLKH